MLKPYFLQVKWKNISTMLSSNNTRQAKKALRRQVLPRRRAMSSEEVSERSKSVCLRALHLAEFSAAFVIAGYMAIQGEIELAEIINNCKRTGKQLILPRFKPATENYEMIAVDSIENDLARGYYGILEPKAGLTSLSDDKLNSEKLTWIVPGVAFSPAGSRLGRGGGWYDKLLRTARGTKVGVGWDWQVCSLIPVDDSDIPMDIIVTESRTIRCGM